MSDIYELALLERSLKQSSILTHFSPVLAARAVTATDRWHKRLCLNCGEKGPHFVPPSLGDEGFYACEERP